MRIIGYPNFIRILKAAYLLSAAGIPSHVLVVSPPGTAKTTAAKLFAKAVGASFLRVTGRHDMLPEDFIAEKELEYDEKGRVSVVWRLRAVGRLLAERNPTPAVWLFDEFDKLSRKSMMALLELMEEQQVTLPNGRSYPLRFMLIASGNSKKYDRDANPIPRSVRDRFTAYWELGYLPRSREYEVLRAAIAYKLGEDTEPDTEQFSLDADPRMLREEVEKTVEEYGECMVDAVRSLRADPSVVEPPGPRAYIHAVLLTAALRAMGVPDGEAAVLGFEAGVAGKLTVASGESPFDLCRRYVEKLCLRRGRGLKLRASSSAQDIVSTRLRNMFFREGAQRETYRNHGHG